MRYAIISDIHANIAALRAVLADAQDMKVEKIICIGDVLGYGPDPVPALEAVYSRAHVCLAGNHDDAVCGRCSTEDFNDFAAAAVSRQRRALAHEAIAWLKELPYVCAMDGFACAHGDFSDPENFNYVQDAEDALPSWEVRQEQLLFVGHTHQPGVYMFGADGVPRRFEPVDFALESGARYLVNVGSVGYPRSGICRSSYCIYDSDTRSVFFRSLPFDLEGYREKMGGKGLDEAPWMTARAAARATPLVRGKANFGKVVSAPQRVKVLTVERSEPRAITTESPRRRRSWAPMVFIAMLVIGLGTLLALYGMGGSAKPSLNGVKGPDGVKVLNGVRDLEGVKGLSDVKDFKAVGELQAPVAAPAPRVPSMVLDKRTLRLAPGDDRIYFAVKLSPKSHPVKVRLVFADAGGNPMPGGEVAYPPVSSGITHATARSAVPVPAGAAEVTLEVNRIETGLSEIVRLELDVRELKGEKKK